MESIEQLDPETLEALNALLQDERASVEVEVALSNGATERAERETIVAMGVEEVGFCCSLHEFLEARGAFVTRHVNGIVLTIISTEHYDERLRAFAAHQKECGERAHQLNAIVDVLELRQLLTDIYDAHVRSTLWSENRADQFARSHLLVFRGGGNAHDAESATVLAPDSLAGPDAVAGTSAPPEARAESDDAPYESGQDEGDWPDDSYPTRPARRKYPADEE
jgi:hypothetical protein